MTLPDDTHPAIRAKLDALHKQVEAVTADLAEEVDVLKATLAIGTDYYGICMRTSAIMQLATRLMYLSGGIAVLRHIPYDIREWKKDD